MGTPATAQIHWDPASPDGLPERSLCVVPAAERCFKNIDEESEGATSASAQFYCCELLIGDGYLLVKCPRHARPK